MVLSVEALFKLGLFARNIIRTEEQLGGNVHINADDPVIVAFEEDPNLFAEIHRDGDLWFVQFVTEEEDPEALLN